MYCHFCGKENSDDHAFCIYCGTTLEPLDMPVKKKRTSPPEGADAQTRDNVYEEPAAVPAPAPKPKKSGRKKKKKKKSGLPKGIIILAAVLLLVMITELIVLLVIPSRPSHGANLNGNTQTQSNDRPLVVIDENTNGATGYEPAPTTAPAITPAPTPVPTPVPTAAPTPAPAARTPYINAENLTLPDIHNQGASFSLSGKISCDIGLITNVSAIVYDSGRNIVMNCSDKPNRMEYQLFNSSIDYNMTFGKLAAGNYTIEINVTARNGDAEAISTVASRSFTVQSAYSGTTTDNGVTIIG